MFAKILVVKQLPSFVTQRQTKFLKKEFEDFALKNATAKENYVLKTDAIIKYNNRYQMLEDNAKSNSRKNSNRENSSEKNSREEKLLKQ